MNKQGDSPNYKYGGSCRSAKDAQQLTFIYGGAAVRQHVRFRTASGSGNHFHKADAYR